MWILKHSDAVNDREAESDFLVSTILEDRYDVVSQRSILDSKESNGSKTRSGWVNLKTSRDWTGPHNDIK